MLKMDRILNTVARVNEQIMRTSAVVADINRQILAIARSNNRLQQRRNIDQIRRQRRAAARNQYFRNRVPVNNELD